MGNQLQSCMQPQMIGGPASQEEPQSLVQEYQKIITQFQLFLKTQVDLDAPRDPNRQHVFLVKMSRRMLSQLFTTQHSDLSSSNRPIYETPLIRQTPRYTTNLSRTDESYSATN